MERGVAAAQVSWSALVPKEETQALLFVKEVADGRGVVAAVLDTGVDLDAVGLQMCPDGLPKILDTIDASGSGDVAMTVVRDASDNVIEGVGGRKLRLSAAWKNPTGKWRVGSKLAFDLYPQGLVDRLRKERKREIDEQHTPFIAQLRRTEGKEKKDAEAAVEVLNSLVGTEDAGPIIDCVVWHDGSVWRAVIGSTDSGDLSALTPLTDYDVERKGGAFGVAEQLPYVVHIYDNGATLSIVTVCGSHGTHVAAILAANHPEHPELNGAAPGARIVSIKIGDSRIGTMETGTALCRAAAAIMKHKCDLVNMSYGEPVAVLGGRFAEIASELVEKGVIFVASAGNNGPALGTVGAPGGTTHALIGVGAYVTPAMATVQHSLRVGTTELPTTPFSWSSRGPSTDGSLGVCICAPGGAVTAVPPYTLQRTQLMNGTSMSSPNAAGCVALLLSGLKAKKILYCPALVRRALENTAKSVPGEVWAVGRGLLQVHSAFEWLAQPHAAKYADVDVYADEPKKGGRGVVIRDAADSRSKQEVEMRVNTVFLKATKNDRKTAFERRIRIKCTVPWLFAPAALLLTNGERRVNVLIDPTKMEEETFHLFGEVQGFDEEEDAKTGPLFRFPVTLIRPQEVGVQFGRSLELVPAQAERFFLTVPRGATTVKVTITGHGDTDPNRRVVVHLLQALPAVKFTESSTESYLTVGPDEVGHVSMPVMAHATLEVCVAQNWSSLGIVKCDLLVEFQSLHRYASPIDLHNRWATVPLYSAFRTEEVHPALVFKRVASTVRPTSSVIFPFSGDMRDVILGRHVCQMNLTYAFRMNEAADVSVHVPAISSYLYESSHESQLWTVYNANKKIVKSGDAWPKPFKVGRGDYTVVVELRHEKREVLDKCKDINLTIKRSLSKEVTGALFDNLQALIVDGARASASRKIAAHETVVLYAAAPRESALPSDVKPGDVLIGHLALCKDDKYNHHAHVHCPIGATKASPLAGELAPSCNDDGATAQARLDSWRWQTEMERLGALIAKRSREDFALLSRDMLTRRPRSLELLRKVLQEAAEAGTPEESVTAADVLLGVAQAHDLSILLQREGDDEDAAARKEAEAAKEAMIDALCRKTEALAKSNKSIDDALKQLKRWVDTEDAKYAHLMVTCHASAHRNGQALKALNKVLPSLVGDPKERMLHEQRLQLVAALNAVHLLPLLRRTFRREFPTANQPPQ